MVCQAHRDGRTALSIQHSRFECNPAPAATPLRSAPQAWHELGPKWPDAFWDDWLREPAQVRTCGRVVRGDVRGCLPSTTHARTQGRDIPPPPPTFTPVGQRAGRSFLRPEISRTLTFGAEGVSMAQFYDKYLGASVAPRGGVPSVGQRGWGRQRGEPTRTRRPTPPVTSPPHLARRSDHQAERRAC